MKKILITGASSALGNAVSRKMLGAGYEVIGTYYSNPPKDLTVFKNFRSLQAPFETPSVYEEVGERIDYLIHIVSAIPSMNLSDELMLRYNVDVTQTLIEICKKRGCEKFIFTSSMAAYGNVSSALITEETISEQPDAYGKSKLLGESLFLDLLKNGHEVLITRLPGIVGKNTKHNFLSKTLERIKKKETIKISNPQSKFNNLAHIEDLSSFFLRFLEERLTISNNPIFNFASREHMEFESLIKEIYALLGLKPDFSITPSSKGAFLISTEKLEATGHIPFSTTHALERFVLDSL